MLVTRSSELGYSQESPQIVLHIWQTYHMIRVTWKPVSRDHDVKSRLEILEYHVIKHVVEFESLRESKFIDQHFDSLFVEPETGRIFHPIMEIPN